MELPLIDGFEKATKLLLFATFTALAFPAGAQTLIACEPRTMTTYLVTGFGGANTSTIDASGVPATLIYFNENNVIGVDDNLCGGILSEQVTWRNIVITCTDRNQSSQYVGIL